LLSAVRTEARTEIPGRAGRYQREPGGYRVFIPAPMLLIPSVQIAGELQRLCFRGPILRSGGAALVEITGQSRNRRFQHDRCIELFAEDRTPGPNAEADGIVVHCQIDPVLRSPRGMPVSRTSCSTATTGWCRPKGMREEIVGALEW